VFDPCSWGQRKQIIADELRRRDASRFPTLARNSSGFRMIQLGFAFLYVDKSGFEHLRFVISSPQVNPENVVTVNVSTFDERKDKSCILDPADQKII
jgi:hypothetical protein